MILALYNRGIIIIIIIIVIIIVIIIIIYSTSSLNTSMYVHCLHVTRII